MHSIENGLPLKSIPGDEHFAEYEGKRLDIYALIRLAETLPLENVPLEKIVGHKDQNFWKDANDVWLGPHHILDAIEMSGGVPNYTKLVSEHPEWEEEIRKIEKADYTRHPILIIGNTVVDGMHRLTKAWAEGISEVPAKRFVSVPAEAVL